MRAARDSLIEEGSKFPAARPAWFMQTGSLLKYLLYEKRV